MDTAQQFDGAPLVPDAADHEVRVATGRVQDEPAIVVRLCDDLGAKHGDGRRRHTLFRLRVGDAPCDLPDLGRGHLNA